MVRREIEMPVSPARLWELLTDPAAASTWFGAEVDWAAEPGAPARFSGGEDGDREGRIDEVDPERRLRFRWWPTDRAEERSEVEYVLEPVDVGVRLVVTERRVGAESGPQASASIGNTGWGAWDPWDGRLVGIWAGVAPARCGALAGC